MARGVRGQHTSRAEAIESNPLLCLILDSVLIGMLDMKPDAMLPRCPCQWHPIGEDASHFAYDASVSRWVGRSTAHLIGAVFSEQWRSESFCISWGTR